MNHADIRDVSSSPPLVKDQKISSCCVLHLHKPNLVCGKFLHDHASTSHHMYMCFRYFR
jgi:hypothetical protein